MLFSMRSMRGLIKINLMTSEKHESHSDAKDSLLEGKFHSVVWKLEKIQSVKLKC